MRAAIFLVFPFLALSACQIDENCGSFPIQSGTQEVRCPLPKASHGSPSSRYIDAIVDREAGTVVVEYERESDGARVRETWRIVGEG
jgi:hypothetical protein